MTGAQWHDVALPLGKLAQMPLGDCRLGSEHRRLINMDRRDEENVANPYPHEAVNNLVFRSFVHKRWQTALHTPTPTSSPERDGCSGSVISPVKPYNTVNAEPRPDAPPAPANDDAPIGDAA